MMGQGSRSKVKVEFKVKVKFQGQGCRQRGKIGPKIAISMVSEPKPRFLCNAGLSLGTPMMGQGSKSKVKVESKVKVNGQGQGGRQQGKIEYLRFFKNSTSGPFFSQVNVISFCLL